MPQLNERLCYPCREYRIPLEKVDHLDRTRMFVDTMAKNILYAVPDGYHFDGYLHVLPKDIAKRRELGCLGLSELPTVVIFPGVLLTHGIIKYAKIFGWNYVQSLDLPEMCQLYIRTRQHRHKSFVKSDVPQYSRRSLIVDCDNFHSMEYVDEGVGKREVHKYLNPMVWQFELPSDTFMMIHAENYVLQRKCLHGVVGWTGLGQFSIAVGDGRVHARGLDERLSVVKGKSKPFLRLNGPNPYDLHLTDFSGSIDSYSSIEDAHRLYKRWIKMRDEAVALHERVVCQFGRHAMTEFRAYPKRVEILDTDTGF